MDGHHDRGARTGLGACDRPVLIRVETQASHGYRPLDKEIAELADIRAFTAKHTGLSIAPAP